MRTVAALRAEKHQTNRFVEYVLVAQANAFKGATAMAIALGGAFAVIFCTYALGWWYVFPRFFFCLFVLFSFDLLGACVFCTYAVG